MASIADHPPTKPGGLRSLFSRSSFLWPILLGCFWAVFLASGWIGLDFGKHWDEHHHLQAVKYSLEEIILLPNFYDYPSVPYWINLACSAPDAFTALSDGVRSPGEFQEFLVTSLMSDSHLLGIRAVYLVLSSLGFWWLYLAARQFGFPRMESAIAGIAYAASWEIAYHSRWVATDALLAQFGALTLLAMSLAYRKSYDRSWLRLATIVAALGLGTKYPGGLLLVPILYMTYLKARLDGGGRKILLYALDTVFVFFLTYLISTPGTILQPLAFWNGVSLNFVSYGTGHANYSIEPGIPMMTSVLAYFFTSALSHYWAIAIPLFSLALAGMAISAFSRNRPALLIWIFPLAYFGYMATQHVLLIRNFLILIPFACLGLAFLVDWVQERISILAVRIALPAFLMVVFAVNAGWLAYAGWSITQRGTMEYARDAAAGLSRFPADSVWVSAMVQHDWEGLGLAPELPALVADPQQAQYWMFYNSEDPDHKMWLANLPSMTIALFGPWEVNINYYPSWAGDDRIVVMTKETAESLGVPPLP